MCVCVCVCVEESEATEKNRVYSNVVHFLEYFSFVVLLMVISGCAVSGGCIRTRPAGSR